MIFSRTLGASILGPLRLNTTILGHRNFMTEEKKKIVTLLYCNRLSRLNKKKVVVFTHLWFKVWEMFLFSATFLTDNHAGCAFITDFYLCVNFASVSFILKWSSWWLPIQLVFFIQRSLNKYITTSFQPSRPLPCLQYTILVTLSWSSPVTTVLNVQTWLVSSSIFFSC